MKHYLISIILLIPLLCFSQKQIEFTASIGGTVVDIESLVEKDEVIGTVVSDWGTMNYGISGQFLFAGKGNLGLGVELMYQEMYWYSVEVPYGYYDIYRDYVVSSFKITPILRFLINSKTSFELGPEFNFMDGLNLGLLLSYNYYIPVSDKFEIPIKLRLEILDNIMVTIPISLNAGIRINL